MAHWAGKRWRDRCARAASLGMLCLAGCAPTADEAGDLSEYLLQSLAFARQTADTVLIEELFQPDARYDDYVNQLEYQGIGEIVGYVTSVHEWGDDVYFNLGAVQTSPTGGVGEWFLAAVHRRPILDVITTGTGRDVAVSGVTVIEVAGGRISRAADYSDLATVLLQLGGRIELPDGSVIQTDDLGN